MIIDGNDYCDSQNAKDIIHSVTGIYWAPTIGVNGFGGSSEHGSCSCGVYEGCERQ